jgi:hypothetical protein
MLSTIEPDPLRLEVLNIPYKYKRTEAMVLSINWSKPEGWMLVERARERFS